jgi:hypothetical protein
MSKKNKTEVLPPVRPAVIPDMRAMLDKLVEEKVAQVMAKKSDALFQPYFQGRGVTTGIRKTQTVSEQRRWSRYFKKWGCDVCGTKKRGHYALGRCLNCYRRTEMRLNEIMAQLASEKGSIPVFLDRLGDVAREALKPAPLPPEKRMDLEWIAGQALAGPVKALPAAPSNRKDRPKRTKGREKP